MTKGVVISFDRLALRMPGCYGSETVETPHLDRLAAGGFVFNRHYAENVDPGASGHAWWSGCFQFPRTTGQWQGPALTPAEALNRAGVRTTLLVEGRSGSMGGGLTIRPATTGFQRIVDVEGVDGLDAGWKETPFARLVARGMEEIERLQEQGADSWLLWLKSAGVPVPWLPPRDFAELYLDLMEEEQTGDRSSPGHVDLSEEELEELILAVASLGRAGIDRGEISELEWRLSRAVYAGYVSLLDAQLGKLAAAVEEECAGEPVLLIVTSGRGEMLGTDRLVPAECTPLCDEIVHTPLLLSASGEKWQGRSRSLVQTVDLPATLLEWYGASAAGLSVEGRSLLPIVRNEITSVRDYVCLGDGRGTYGILTEDLYLVRTQNAERGLDNGYTHLFAKPDDLWDVQDVAGQYPEEVELLSETLEAFLEAARSERPLVVPPLPRRVEAE